MPSAEGPKVSRVIVTLLITVKEDSQEAKQPAESKKEAKPVEKETFDIKLISFDASKKITLIKEVRSLLNLGLKEVKRF